MMDNRKEIYKTSPEPISLKQTEKIIEQMKRNNNIYRINNKGNGKIITSINNIESSYKYR